MALELSIPSASLNKSNIPPPITLLPAMTHYLPSYLPSPSAVLGQGWILGFLGLLHMDVFITRLDQEFQVSTIVTAPNVPYQGTVLYISVTKDC